MGTAKSWLALLLVVIIPQAAQQPELIELYNPIAILGDEWRGYALNRPRDFAAGNGDTVYVLDDGDLLVATFLITGSKYLFTFGRSGSGPGEFERPQQIAFSGHSVLVSDYSTHRIEEFSSDGKYLRSIKLPNAPTGEMVVYGGHVYIGMQSQEYSVLRIPLEDPEKMVPLLTYDHPALREFTRFQRSSNSRPVLAAGTDGLIVAFPGYGTFMVIPWGQDPNECSILEPKSELMAAEWKRVRQAMESSPGTFPQFFNSVWEWAPNQVLLEVRTGQASTFRAVAIVVDAKSGQEIGPRIVALEPGHGGMYLLSNNRIAWRNFSNSVVNVFRWTNTR